MINKLLVFDIGITGHHSEYIGHLIDYLANREGGEVKYYFVVHPAFSNTFPEIHNKGEQTKNVYWTPIEDEELRKVQNTRKIRSSLQQYRIMDSYAKQYQVDHVCALDFHTIKYGGIFYRPSYTISSILFLQFHRLSRDTGKQKIEFYKRYYITKWCSRNKQIRNIFVLNDEQTVSYMNKEFNTDCFRMLPDPIPELEALEDFSIHTHYKIDTSRKIFLHIGSLGQRKGTLEVIESARYIAPDDQEQVTLLLAGKASAPVDIDLYLERIETGKKNTNVQIIWDNQFVPTPMMKSLFDQCDAVLLPYKNAEFSSGILGHAAAAKKRVIATGAGLIKELVLKYNLGMLLDRPDAANLAQEISNLLDTPPKLKGQQSFVELHSPEIFAEMVLDA